MSGTRNRREASGICPAETSAKAIRAGNAVRAALCFLVLFLPADLRGQPAMIDSLHKVLRAAKEDTNRVNALNKLAYALYINDPDTTMLLAGQAEILSKKIGFRKGEGNASNALGTAYWVKGDYANALSNYMKALKIHEEIRYREGIATCLGNIGLVYAFQADYPRALEYYFKALKMEEESGNKKGLARNYNNIGIVYLRQRDYTQALNYYQKALKIDEELGNKTKIPIDLGSISSTYVVQARQVASKHVKDSLLNIALDYLRQALKLSEETSQKNLIATTLGNMGSVYTDKGDFSKAIDYLFKALKLREELGAKSQVATAYANIGGTYLKMGKYAQAEDYLQRALSLSQAGKMPDTEKEVEEHLSELYRLTGNYQQALEHYKNYIATRDRLENEENTRKQTRMEMQYEFDKKQAADSISNAEKIKQEALKHEQEISQQRLYTYGGAIGFLLMLVVAGVSFNAYRQKQKANLIISEQKILVEAKQKEILDSIYYARRIQRSLLPSEKLIERMLEHHQKS